VHYHRANGYVLSGSLKQSSTDTQCTAPTVNFTSLIYVKRSFDCIDLSVHIGLKSSLYYVYLYPKNKLLDTPALQRTDHQGPRGPYRTIFSTSIQEFSGGGVFQGGIVQHFHGKVNSIKVSGEVFMPNRLWRR